MLGSYSCKAGRGIASGGGGGTSCGRCWRLGGLAQHQAVADERIEGGVSCISAEAAVRVTARQITEAIQHGQVVYWQVVAAFL
jgi:hypothetical protein